MAIMRVVEGVGGGPRAQAEPRYRILIAEDEPVVAEGLRAQAEALGHRVVGIAFDGPDAVAKAVSLEPEMILLDIRMPGLDGIEAARQIMARRPAPVILITAHTNADLIDRAATAGVMGYLVKPVGRKDLAPAMIIAAGRFQDLTTLRGDAQSV